MCFIWEIARFQPQNENIQMAAICSNYTVILKIRICVHNFFNPGFVRTLIRSGHSTKSLKNFFYSYCYENNNPQSFYCKGL